MTDLFVWLPYSVAGVAIVVLLLVLLAVPDGRVVASRAEPAFGMGAMRVAAVVHAAQGLVIDGLVDRLSSLGPVGAPVTLVVSEDGLDDEAYRLLSRWARDDAVVDIEIPLDGRPERVVDLWSGDAGMRLAMVGLSS